MDLVIQYAGKGCVGGWTREKLGSDVALIRVWWPKGEPSFAPEPWWESQLGLIDAAGPRETKWNHLARLDLVWQTIRAARFVCFADDDVQRVNGSWREAFQLFREVRAIHGVNVGQCALTGDSFHSHEEVLVKPHSRFRLLGFAEMMAPIMTADAAETWREAFRDAGPVAWGVEDLWSGRHPPCVILDETPMSHSRPVRALEHAKRFGVDPVKDREAYMQRWRL